MKQCPICKANFITKGTYSECSNMICPTFLFGEKALFVDFEKVKDLLASPVLTTNKLARSYLSFLTTKGFLTKGQLVYVIGTLSPKGTKTLQSIVMDRTNKKIDLGKWFVDINKDKVEPIKEIGTTKQSTITVVTGEEPPLPTKDFKYIDYPFQFFNPLQSVTANFIEHDVNVVVSAPTSSGKTIVAEQFIAPIVANGKKAIYVSPLKALTQEKYDDWTNGHTFSKYKIEILTGDYILTPARVKEVSAANIILLTSEMLDSRTRKISSEKNDWLYDVGVVIIDEAHLLGMDGRGDNLESAIIRFTEQNPKAKIIFLSATMPNVIELADWLNYLNGKESVLLQSDWRPIKLDIHYTPYYDYGKYKEKEQNKANKIYEILRDFPDDKFIVFTHTKAMGRMVQDMVTTRLRERVEFHSADLTKDVRIRLEKEFKDKDKGLRILVATSTLAWGINAPARRVVVAGVHRGMTEVTSMEIIQMVGRSGRYGIDDKGDAYILIPETDAEYWEERISNSENVISRMKNPDVLTFHAISEIVRGTITNRIDLINWYKRTLAFFQDKRVDFELYAEDIEDALISLQALKIEEGSYKATGLGKVSAWMYYHPRDVYHWYKSMAKMVENKIDYVNNPLWISYVLSMYKEFFPPQTAQGAVSAYKEKCSMNNITIHPSYAYGFTIYSMLTNTLRDEYFFPIAREVKRDIERVVQAIGMIDTMYGKWDIPKEDHNSVKLMVYYEVERKMVDLCKIKWVGKQKAILLYKNGIKTLNDFVNAKYRGIIKGVMAAKLDEALTSAHKVLEGGRNEETLD
jgi:replicative superfamily II helicase